MWTLKLRGRNGMQSCTTCSGSSTVQTLKEEIGALFAWDPLTVQIRFGYPIKVVECDNNQLLQDISLTNHEVLTVSGEKKTGGNSASGSKKKNSSAAKSSSPLTKKAPAMKKATGQKSRNVASLSTLKKSGKAKSGAKKAAPTVVVDKDGNLGSVQSSSATSVPRRRKAIVLSSKSDVQSKLVSAIDGKGGDQTSRFLRSATRNAVTHQYSMVLAHARYAASLAGHFKISRDEQNDGNDMEMINVSFLQSARKWGEEKVEKVTREALIAVINCVVLEGGVGLEMLKPFNMAQCSTRVFWNIARLYQGDVAAGLRDLVPERDWTYLEDRTRQLSEKALENLETESMYKSPSPFEEIQNSKVIIEIEDSSDDAKNEVPVNIINPEEMLQRKRRHAALAAQRRADAHAVPTQETTIHFIPKPEESSLDETKLSLVCDACNKVRVVHMDQSHQISMEADPWTCAKLHNINRTEGCTAPDDEIAQLVGLQVAGQLERQGILRRRELASYDGSSRTLSCTPAELEGAVLEAQGLESDDIFAEILGDACHESWTNQFEAAKLATVPALCATPFDMIQSSLTPQPSREMVLRWLVAAEQCTEDYPWLSDYVG